MFLLLTMFLLSQTLWASEQNFNCPDGTFKTDFISPVTYQRRVFCSKRLADGTLVQHEIVAQKEEITEPTTPLLQEDYGFMKTAIQEFLYLILPVKSPHRGTVFYGGFSTDKCHTSRLRQKDFFINQSDPHLPLRPRFALGCSLQGQSIVTANKPSKIQFETKLSHYLNLEMIITVKLAPIKNELFEAQITMKEGKLTHPQGHLEFESEYTLSLTSEMELREPHHGKLKIISVAAKNVNQELPLKLLEAPTQL